MNKLELLRHVVKNLGTVPLQPGSIDADNTPFGRAKFGPQGMVGVLKAGAEAYSDLADAILQSGPEYLRGTTFEELSSELFEILLRNFVGRSTEITVADLALVEGEIANWFSSKSATHHLHIPCILAPQHAPTFGIGPVQFTYISDFVAREGTKTGFQLNFGMMLSGMEAQRAFWIAEINVPRCMQKRAQELGTLSIDIAIAGIQLAVHPVHSRYMSRLAARTVPRHRIDVSIGNGLISPSVTNQEPGLLLGPGTLGQFLREKEALLTAVGRRISAFIDASGALPTLDLAWADAAYWYHEGLAEPLDTIAVTKLETAIEVLLRSQSTRGSAARVIKAIRAFYGLEPDQFINPNSQTTVKRFAEDLVRDRSRILHGTWSTLVHSMRTSRASLEILVAGLLAGYASELKGYTASSGAKDDITSLLSFVHAKRKVSART